jgi:hypothetical protein
MSHCWVHRRHPHGWSPPPPSPVVVQYSYSATDPADPAIAILIGAANRGAHGVLIHQLEDLHRWDVVHTEGAEGYGREDEGNRGGEECSLTCGPATFNTI